MGKKTYSQQPEMSQVYNPSSSEFIFNESGGKGKHLSSFLKNLSISSSHHHGGINSTTTNLISSSISPPPNTTPLQRSISTPIDSSKVFGTPLAHLTNGTHNHNYNATNTKSPYTFNNKNDSISSLTHSPNRSPEVHKHRNSDQYCDLDDDWDANVDNSLKSMMSAPKSIENKPIYSNSKLVRTVTATSDHSSNKSSLNLSLQPSLMLDSLYPDLTPSGIKTHINGLIKDSNQNLASNSVSNFPSYDKFDLKTNAEIEQLNAMNSKFLKFKKIISQDNINIHDLKKLSWNGIPHELRPIAWQLLLGYLPTNSSRRITILERKRQEYLDGIQQSFNQNKDPQMWHQIKIDVPRTNPHIKLYSFPSTQESLKRILYLWSVRHPASGYVQGINDLCTPFYQTFLTQYINEDVSSYDPGQLPQDIINNIEADTFWCLTKLLDTITDNYIHEQPGIIRQVNELKNLIGKIDYELLKHLEAESVEFIQFSFRWINCLLMRELNINLIIRMWDTYLSETPLGFNHFHVYVCAAFLIKFSDDLKRMDFQEIMLFLQNPPTKSWDHKDVELMLSEAFIWQSLYKNAAAHLR